jgi:hypothetical protein
MSYKPGTRLRSRSRFGAAKARNLKPQKDRNDLMYMTPVTPCGVI